MGIRTDPGYELFVTPDNGCFDAGKTPKKIYCQITGVKTGEWWVPEAGQPANKTFILEWQGNNTWKYENGFEACTLQMDTGFTLLWAVNKENMNFFTSSGNSGCTFQHDNDWSEPHLAYYGGYANLFVREDVGDPPSLKKSLDNMGEVSAYSTLAEGVVKDGGIFGQRFARKSDGTCIRIFY